MFCCIPCVVFVVLCFFGLVCFRCVPFVLLIVLFLFMCVCILRDFVLLFNFVCVLALFVCFIVLLFFFTPQARTHMFLLLFVCSTGAKGTLFGIFKLTNLSLPDFGWSDYFVRQPAAAQARAAATS